MVGITYVDDIDLYLRKNNVITETAKKPPQIGYLKATINYISSSSWITGHHQLF